MAQISNTTILPDTKLGWVDQPNQRGTIDIIWSCLLVIFTSTWTVLHMHLPAEGEGEWDVFVRKTRWSIFAVYAPEALTLVAACQWSCARESVPMMHSIGVTNWTIAHGFYADSGGFILHSPNIAPFPVNSRALHHLVKHGYVEKPTMTEKDLEDVSKADRFAKAVAFVQSTYLVVQCIARAAQSLEVTCLELLTAALVVCSVVSYCFWMNKPQGIASHTHIHTDTPMADILIHAGDPAKKPYSNTPMDFVEQPGWSVWRRREMFAKFGGLEDRPIHRIPNDYVQPPFTLRLAIPLWLLTVAHASLHVVGWNFSFPTRVEQILWRSASLTLLVDLFSWGLAEVLSVKPDYNFTLTILGIWEKNANQKTFWRRWAVDGPAVLSVFLFATARTILVVQALMSLRLLPGSVFITVNWTTFIPHV